MKSIKERSSSTIDKLRSATTSTTSNDQTAHKSHALPDWLRKLFAIFTVAYKNAWTDPLCSDQMRQATDRLWFNALKGFAPEIIIKAAEQTISIFKFPPAISEFIELASAIQRREKFDKEIIDREKNRLLEKQPNRVVAKKFITQIKENLKNKI